jgi:hypothetical protein
MQVKTSVFVAVAQISVARKKFNRHLVTNHSRRSEHIIAYYGIFYRSVTVINCFEEYCHRLSLPLTNQIQIFKPEKIRYEFAERFESFGMVRSVFDHENY